MRAGSRWSLRMPDHDWHWDDLVRGRMHVRDEHVPDFVIVRANGEPLYTLVNPVDDVAMGITHVLRGGTCCPARRVSWRCTRRGAPVPRFGHLPYVMGRATEAE